MRNNIWIAAAGLIAAACAPAAPPPSAEVAEARSEAVAAAVEVQNARFAEAAPVAQADRATAYQFEFEGLYAPRVPMTAFDGEVVLVVNTASRCGYTPQYAGLQEIFEQYSTQGFQVLGVPANNFAGQEPGSSEDIREFCELNYGVTFPMAARTDVIGERRHPFYVWAEAQLGEAAVPQWNFHKLLIGRDGRLIRAFPSATEPTAAELREAITAALAQ